MTTQLAVRTEEQAPNGMAPTGIQSEVLLVGPEQARQWLEECKFEGQRPLSRSKVEELKAALEAGEFEATMIKLYVWLGRWYLVDGQHRLTAIMESGVPGVLFVARHQARSYDEILKAYGRLDIGKVRTTGDALYAARVHESAGLSLDEAKRVASALRHLMTGFSAATSVSGANWKSKNRDMLGRGVIQWKDEAQTYFRILDGSLPQHRLRLVAPVVLGIALITLRYQPEAASVFWRSIAMRERLDPYSGEWWAAEIIGDPERWNQYRTAEYAHRLVGTWNAAFKGRKLKKTLVQDPKRPLNILGTKVYNGQREVREQF